MRDLVVRTPGDSCIPNTIITFVLPNRSSSTHSDPVALTKMPVEEAEDTAGGVEEELPVTPT